MKTVDKIILAGFIFLLGVAVGWIIEGQHLTLIFSSYLPALATLFAAYLGTKYAFDLQLAKEKEEINNRNIVNGNLTIFDITRMINSLLAYQRQIIDPVRNKPSAFLEMSPTLFLPKEDLTIKFSDLSFLIESEDPNLLGELSIAEQKYEKALDAINARSNMHLHEVQPRLERAGIKEGGDYRMTDIEEVLGNRLFVTIKQSTSDVISHVDETVEYLQGTGNRLSSLLKNHLPAKKVFSISIPESIGPNE